MKNWISSRVSAASWTGFLVWFAILFLFSSWAFSMDSPWTRALEFAGGKLPEMQPGIPAIEPVRSMQAMGDNVDDYLLWQLLDIPYAVMNVITAWMGMGLGLKAMRMENSILRQFAVLPLIYFACELIENTLVALFASGMLATSEGFVLFQQVATTLKFASGMPSMGLAMLGAAIAILIGAIRMVRKSS